MRPGPTEILILVFVVLLLFGAGRLPKLARSLREARKEFEAADDESTETTTTTDGGSQS